MATRNISIRLSLQDQEVVRRALQNMGAEGQAALKKIEAGGPPASNALLALNGSAAAAKRGMLALGVSVTAIAAGFGLMIKNAIDTADHLYDVSQATGIAVKTLSGLDLVAKQSGVSLDQVAKGVGFMSRAMVKSPEIFRAFGISLAEIRSGSITAKEALARVADTIDAMPDGLQKSALAALALGRSAAEMTAFLNEGGDAIRNASGVITDNFAKAADEFNDKIVKLQQQFLGVSAGVAEALLDPMTRLADVFSDTEFQNGLKGFANFLIDTGTFAAQHGKEIAQLAAAFAAMGAGASVGAVAGSFFGPGGAVLGAGIGGVAGAITGGVGAGMAMSGYEDGGQMSNAAALAARIRQEEETISRIRTVSHGTALADLATHQRVLDALIKRRDSVQGIAKIEGGATDAEIQKRVELSGVLQKQTAEEIAGAKEKAAAQLNAYRDLLAFQNSAYNRARDEDQLADDRAVKLSDYITGLERTNRLAGMSVVAREQELAVMRALEIAVTGITATEEARIRNAAALRIENEEAAAAAKKMLADISATAERVADDMSEFLVDGFVNAAEGGKSTFENMWDGALAGGKRFLANIAAEILKQNFILPITTSIVSAVPGLFGIQGGASGGGGGGSGALGLASNGLSLGNFFSGGALTSGISSSLFGTAGVGVAAGAQGAALPATSGLLGSGGFAGAAGGVLPYAGAAIAAVGILRSLGVIGPGKSVGPNAGAQLIETGGVFGLGPAGADNGGSTAGVIAQVNQAVEVLNALAMGIGVAQVGDGIASFIDTFKAGGIGNAADLVKDAISKGVIEGLTEAEQALISGSGNLGATAEAIIAARAETTAFPAGIAARRLQIENPRQFAIDALNIERDGLVARANALGDGTQTLLDIEAIYQSELADINTRFAVGLAAAVDDGSAAIARFQEYMDGLAVKAKDLAEFRVGVSDLLLQDKDPAGFAALQIDREEQGMKDRAKVLGAGAETILQIEEHFGIKRADIVADSVTAIVAANDNLDLFSGQIAAISTGAADAARALQDTAGSLQDFLNALDGGPLSSLALADQYRLAKDRFNSDPSPQNAQEFLAVSREFSPNALAFSRDSGMVRSALGSIIAAAPGQIESVHAQAAARIRGLQEQREAARLAPLIAAASDVFWDLRRTGTDERQAAFAAAVTGGGEFNGVNYAAGFGPANLSEFGHVPRFAMGGITPPDRPFIVGESGPEIMRMSLPGFVTPNAVNSADVAREIRQMRQELNAALISIAINTSDTARVTRKFDGDGMPAVRVP